MISKNRGFNEKYIMKKKKILKEFLKKKEKKKIKNI